MKSSFPILVDISVTQVCHYGCDFCYRGSTPQGEVADVRYLTKLADALKALGTMEIVLGGGEPTIVPQIDEMVRIFKRRDFNVGLTTHNYGMYVLPNIKTLAHHLDSLAFSVNSFEELSLAYTCARLLPPGPVISIQSVLGLRPLFYLKEMMERAADLGFEAITLLGYKQPARSAAKAPFAISEEWISVVLNSKLKVGIDAVLVSKYRHNLIAAGIEPSMLSGEEGEQSCFIDAVEKHIRKSSYADYAWGLSEDPTAQELSAQFAGF